MEKLTVIERICVACRISKSADKLIKLTVDSSSSNVVLNQYVRKGQTRANINGRSAYLCPSVDCVNSAIKSGRLKLALTGRKVKSAPVRRQISWPLESQLIKDILSICTEPEKTCQNTSIREA